MDFTLFGRKITISEGRRNYMEILNYYKGMADQAEIDFRQEYDSTLGSVFFKSTYAERFKKTYGSDNYMDEIARRYVVKTRQYLTKYGVYNLSDAEIWKNGVLAEDRSVSRLQYEFNTFILECLSSVEDANGDDDMFISKLQSRFNGNFFPTCLYNDVMGLCDYVTEYLDEHKIAAMQFVYKQQVTEAEAYYANLLEADIPVAEKEKLAYSLIELDPRKKQYYEYIFIQHPKARYEIAAIAKYLSVDLSDLIEKELRRSIDVKSIACEEDALKMMANLQDMMEKFGVSQSSRKGELEAILCDYDIKARTYDGILYDTRELRERAATDDKMLYDLHGEVAGLDKNMCNTYLRQIVQMEIVSAIKNKHLQYLNDRITCIDNEHLERLLAGLDDTDEVQCNCLKEQVLRYDAAEEVKASFVVCIEKRIYSIWDAEDFERFTELYFQTPVSNSEQIEKNVVLIRESGRTEIKERFIKALYLLHENEILAAAKYAVAKESGLLASLVNMGKKEIYEILTLNGRVMHPAILRAMEEAKAKKSNGILTSLGFGKNKAKQPTQTTSAKFCTTCGSPVDNRSKFCSRCGNKLS